jgi:hypothetical protein
MSEAIRNLLKRCYLARIERLIAEGYTVAEATKAAEVFLLKHTPQPQPEPKPETVH